MRMLSVTLMLCIVMMAHVTAHDSPEVLIENATLRVRISSDGAELQSIVAKKTDREFLWQGDPEFWGDRAPLMFPVNVRFKGDRYTHQGKSYVIPKMGLAIYRRFNVIPSSIRNEATFELSANRDTLRQYPFPFRLRVTYRLEENRLINEFVIENNGNQVMPFALGGHPGFTFPITDDTNRDDFEYRFSRPLTIDRKVISDSLIQTDVVPFLKNESSLTFGDDRIPDGGLLIVDSPSRMIGLARRGEEPFVTVELGDFPNVNLWSPPGFPYACIEPMIAHHDFQDSPDAIEEKRYLIRLNPGESKTYRFTITIHAEA